MSEEIKIVPTILSEMQLPRSAKSSTCVLGIAAGKGGVGKSMLTVNLAMALQEGGYQVGILDADVYGPSLKKMLVEDVPVSHDERDPRRLKPAEHRGIKLMSMAYFQGPFEATIVRAPVANGVISQFLHQVEWGGVDYLLIDFPPGTGDVQLTLVQQAGLWGVVMVTTPQEVSLLDVRKSLSMFEQMGVPVLGVVENMSYFQEAEGGIKHFPLGQGGGARLSEERRVDFLGQIPLDSAISTSSDRGISVLTSFPDTPLSSIFRKIADQLRSLPTPLCIDALEQVDDFLRIRWSDGVMTEYNTALLQRRCPCVRCAQKKDFDEQPVGVVKMHKVGRYALRLEFTRGCSEGIYPLSLLRTI